MYWKSEVWGKKIVTGSAEAAAMIRSAMAQVGAGFSKLLFPPMCSFCDQSHDESSWFLCRACRDEARTVPHRVCPQCGIPYPSMSAECAPLCGRCLTDPPPYSRARYGLLYQGRIREALIRFKYQKKLYYRRTFAAVLVEVFRQHFRPDEFDVVVPVPIHRTRLLSRGFNQAAVLAASVSRATGIALDRSALRKTRDTRPQVGLSRAERVKNLRGTFAVVDDDRFHGRRVLLIDDVATTGTTLAECACTLTRAGAARVDALVLALRVQGEPDDIVEREAERERPVR